MTNFISEQILEEIQLKNDIVEVISQYMPLKRAGANYRALCPFHNEHTPSFMVSPSKQIFHCFGCGEGGNVFGFVMKYEHLGFIDAVKHLAGKTGVIIPEKVVSKDEAGSKALWDINKFAAEAFKKWLRVPVGSYALNYLRKRGINDAIIKKLHLGFAPDNNELCLQLKKGGFSFDLARSAGLITGGGDKFRDMFRGRLIIPVFNVTGKIAGFSGRVLDNALPKYINTPETSIFHKGKVLYGLNFSKSEIIKERQVVICEGHFDFIRLFQEGLYNVVASQGTAFTEDQVHMLRRYTDEIIVSFDSDAAGNKAALAGLEMFLNQGLQVRVAVLPKPFDPDSFVKEKGIGVFKNLIKNAENILYVKFQSLCKEYSIDAIEGKLKVISLLLPDMDKIRNEIWKRQFVKHISAKLNIPEDSLWIELKKHKQFANKGKENARHASSMSKVISEKKDFKAERFLLQLLLNDEPVPEVVKNILVLDELQSLGYRSILKIVLELKGSGQWRGMTSLMSHIKDENLVKLISQLVAEDVYCPERIKAVCDCLYNIKRSYRERMIKEFINEIERKEKNGKEDINGLIFQVNQLQKELMQLEHDSRKKIVAV